MEPPPPLSNDRMPDAEESSDRVTKDGRTLRYCLNVIQQPERARACGSGAKSSADRRPVDPPPVVELRIFDFTLPESPQDVTFAYDANFFLFATLEVARPIVHGRGQPVPTVPQVPVLTGMPVSGMAYLDRPSEAGYFIFPDLSVRHEGCYKLSFNLYEESKPNNLPDGNGPRPPPRERPEWSGPLPSFAGGADSSFDWRMEIKSNAFDVFSAKKFPGLAESTMLSKTVAEQGCRVRIRRDVRMRRRDGKDDDAYNDVDDDTYVRPIRMASPGAGTSEETSRRESIDYAGQAYTSPSTSMSPTSSGPAYTAVVAQPLHKGKEREDPVQYHRAGGIRSPTEDLEDNDDAVPSPSMPAGDAQGSPDVQDLTPKQKGKEKAKLSPKGSSVTSSDQSSPRQISQQSSPAMHPPQATHSPVGRITVPYRPPLAQYVGHRHPLIGPIGPLFSIDSVTSHTPKPPTPTSPEPAPSISARMTHRALPLGDKRPYDAVFDSIASTAPVFKSRRRSTISLDSDEDKDDDDDDDNDNEEAADDDDIAWSVGSLSGMLYKRADGSRFEREIRDSDRE